MLILDIMPCEICCSLKRIEQFQTEMNLKAKEEYQLVSLMCRI